MSNANSKRRIAAIIGLVLLMVITTLSMSVPSASAAPFGGWCTSVSWSGGSSGGGGSSTDCGNRTKSDCESVLSNKRIFHKANGATHVSGWCYFGGGTWAQQFNHQHVAASPVLAPVSPGPVPSPGLSVLAAPLGRFSFR